jgi:UDP-N-acetylmuramyl tripeptide synthase
MTDKQLKQAQDLKRTIAMLENELEKLDQNHPIGINVFLPDCGNLIEDVRNVFEEYKQEFNEIFRKL